MTNIIPHANSTHITFSWDIPPVLESIEIVFSLFLRYINDSTLIANVSNITTNSWTIELSQDPCILGNLTITGTVGTLKSSSYLSNVIFPHSKYIDALCPLTYLCYRTTSLKFYNYAEQTF